PPADPAGIQPVPPRPDDRRRDGVDAGVVRDLHHQPRDDAEVPHQLSRTDARVPALRDLPVSLSRAPEGRRRQPVRPAAERSAAPRVRRAVGRVGRRHHLRHVSQHLLMSRSKVAILKTSPATVLRDYHELMNLAGYQTVVAKDADTALKVTFCGPSYYPTGPTAPGQLEGVIKAMKHEGYNPELIHACHNRTVVIDAHLGERENKQITVVEA